MQGPRETPLPVLKLSDYGLVESDLQKSLQPQIVVVCAWCGPTVDGSTSTICAECEAKYFPKK